MSRRKSRHNARTRAARQLYVPTRAATDVPNTHPSVAEDVGAIAASVNQPTPPAFHNAPKHGGIFDV